MAKAQGTSMQIDKLRNSSISKNIKSLERLGKELAEKKTTKNRIGDR